MADKANSFLKKALWSCIFIFITLEVMIFAPKSNLTLVGFAVYVVFFFAFHLFLGRAAHAAGRSWVLYGLLPILWPVIGGVIAYSVLRGKVNS